MHLSRVDLVMEVMEQPYLVYGLTFAGIIVLLVSLSYLRSSMMKTTSSLFFESWVVFRGARRDEDDILGSGFIPLH